MLSFKLALCLLLIGVSQAKPGLKQGGDACLKQGGSDYCMNGGTCYTQYTQAPVPIPTTTTPRPVTSQACQEPAVTQTPTTTMVPVTFPATTQACQPDTQAPTTTTQVKDCSYSKRIGCGVLQGRSGGQIFGGAKKKSLRRGLYFFPFGQKIILSWAKKKYLVGPYIGTGKIITFAFHFFHFKTFSGKVEK